MKDEYNDFLSLSKKEKLDEDYQIRSSNRNSDFLIMAPHGGSIEGGTSEIALSIAGDDFSFYLFEGIKRRNNKILHITSARFDEPQAIDMAKNCESILTIHGESSDEKVVYIGGLNSKFKKKISDSLIEAEFTVGVNENPALDGKSRSNICNYGRSRAGVQLELAHGLRHSFFTSLSPTGRKTVTPEFNRFVGAIRRALQ